MKEIKMINEPFCFSSLQTLSMKIRDDYDLKVISDIKEDFEKSCTYISVSDEDYEKYILTNDTKIWYYAQPVRHLFISRVDYAPSSGFIGERVGEITELFEKRLMKGDISVMVTVKYPDFKNNIFEQIYMFNKETLNWDFYGCLPIPKGMAWS